MLVIQFVMILPCIFYYAFRSLRMSCDCFVCFNRIPHLRYSIYQYNAYERNIQKEERYFGMGAVNAYNNLIDDELRRTMFPSSEVSRRSTLVKASRGQSLAEAEMEYAEYKMECQRMQYLLNAANQIGRRPLENSFGKRSIPFTDEDVRRIGGEPMDGEEDQFEDQDDGPGSYQEFEGSVAFSYRDPF